MLRIRRSQVLKKGYSKNGVFIYILRNFSGFFFEEHLLPTASVRLGYRFVVCG